MVVLSISHLIIYKIILIQYPILICNGELFASWIKIRPEVIRYNLIFLFSVL